jgi:amidase
MNIELKWLAGRQAGQHAGDFTRFVRASLGAFMAVWIGVGSLPASAQDNESCNEEAGLGATICPADDSRAGLAKRSRSLREKGETAKAIEDLTAAIQLDPGNAQAYYHRGNAYQDTGDYNRALDDLGQAIAIDPGFASAYHDRGVIFYDRRDYERALADLKRLGAVLVPTTELDNTGNAGLAELGLIPNDFKANLDHYLATEAPTPKSGVKSLVDVMLYNQQHPDKVKYGQSLIIASAAQPGSREAASAGSLALRTTEGAAIDHALQADHLDAFLAPGANLANVGASAGYPTVIVPSGLVSDKQPQGLSFMGTAWSEARLLRYAAAYEAGTHRRVPPTDVNDALIRGC